MLGSYALLQSAAPRFAIEDTRRSAFEERSPRQNHLLAALLPQDYERLLPKLEPMPLPQGLSLHKAGDRERYLYFPTAGIVSRYQVMSSGASAEFAVTGNEGVIGVSLFLGGESTTSRAVVLCAGHGYRLSAELLKCEFEHDGPLPRLLLRYTQALIAQIGLISACKRHHSLDQQLSRWLLSCMDRLPTDELAITQRVIADMLGVRREGVSEAAGRLQGAGLIRVGRGRIVVLDRPALEAHACECYAGVKREYDSLLADCRQPEVASRSRVVTRTKAVAEQTEAWV